LASLNKLVFHFLQHADTYGMRTWPAVGYITSYIPQRLYSDWSE